MIYDIGLTLTHEYELPTQGGRHALRLMPADLPDLQRAITTFLDITPRPGERTQRVDFFGNAVIDVALTQPHEEITFRLRSRVERQDKRPGLDISPDPDRLAEELAAHRSLSPASPHHFIGPSPRVKALPQLAAYARQQLQPHMSTLDAVKAVGHALHRDIKFDAGATNVDTPPEEAFAARHGVCQDFTHMMIAGLRGVGVPAAYVSGFLRTEPPPGQKRLEGADAMHAWVRAWCGEDMGWVEYDPTNNMYAAGDHIAIAYGRDYADTAPVRGVIRTAGAQSASHSVDVVALKP